MSAVKLNTTAVLDRIREASEGTEPFRTQTGKPVTVEVAGRWIIVTSITRPAVIREDELDAALKMVPVKSYTDLPEAIWGRSYLFALLSDARVRGNDW